MKHRNIRLLLAALFALNCPTSLVFARGNKEKLATAIFEDQTNRTEFSAINVGTTTAVKLFTPNRYVSAREDRHLRVQNTSAASSFNNLHIATYTLKMQDIFICATCTVNTFVIPTGAYLDLSPKTTYYGIYDSGASSTGVHVQVDFHDPSGTDAAGN